MKLKEEKNKKRKVIVTSSISILVLLLIVGISYAFWQTTKVQNDTNIIASGCFGVSLEGNEAIKLSNAYPVDSITGMSNVPYTFTITNTCSGSANYIVNLESLASTTFQNSSIRVALDETDKLYSDYEESNKYYSDSKEARTLISGTLEDNGSVTYNLRMWIDENASNSEQNKVFASKIVVTTAEGEIIKSLADQVELGDYIKMMPTSTSYTPLFNITGCMNDESCMQNTINPSELDLWRVIKKNDDGTVDVVSEYVSSEEIYFYGMAGYLNFIGGLNEIAAQYTNPKYVQSTRHMGFNAQIETCTGAVSYDDDTLCPGDNGYEKDLNLIKSAIGTLVGKKTNGISSNIWCSSRYYSLEWHDYYGRFIKEDGELLGNSLWNEWPDGSQHYGLKSNSIRPILTLKSNNKIIKGDGKSENTAYNFE